MEFERCYPTELNRSLHALAASYQLDEKAAKFQFNEWADVREAAIASAKRHARAGGPSRLPSGSAYPFARTAHHLLVGDSVCKVQCLHGSIPTHTPARNLNQRATREVQKMSLNIHLYFFLGSLSILALIFFIISISEPQ